MKKKHVLTLGGVMLLLVIAGIVFMKRNDLYFSKRNVINNMPSDAEIIHSEMVDDYLLQIGKTKDKYYFNYSQKKGIFYKPVRIEKQLEPYETQELTEFDTLLRSVHLSFEGKNFAMVFSDSERVEIREIMGIRSVREVSVMPKISEGLFFSQVDASVTKPSNRNLYAVGYNGTDVKEIGLLALYYGESERKSNPTAVLYGNEFYMNGSDTEFELYAQDYQTGIMKKSPSGDQNPMVVVSGLGRSQAYTELSFEPNTVLTSVINYKDGQSSQTLWIVDVGIDELVTLVQFSEQGSEKRYVEQYIYRIQYEEFKKLLVDAYE